MGKSEVKEVSVAQYVEAVENGEVLEVHDLGSASFSVCRNAVSGDCIAVSTSDGRYAIIR